MDSLTAPQVDEKNDRNVVISNPESLPQVSPKDSQNQEGNPQNGESIENGDSNLLKEDTNDQPSNGNVIFHQLLNGL